MMRMKGNGKESHSLVRGELEAKIPLCVHLLSSEGCGAQRWGEIGKILTLLFSPSRRLIMKMKGTGKKKATARRRRRLSTLAGALTCSPIFVPSESFLGGTVFHKGLSYYEDERCWAGESDTL